MLHAISEIILIGVKQYGALFVLVGFVCFILWYVLKYTIKDGTKREEAQRKIINSQIKELRLQRRQRHKDHTQMSQALKEIVTALGRINGYKPKGG